METACIQKARLGAALTRGHLAVAAALVFLAGCAATSPAPTEQLAVATATVSQAVSAGAGELASTELSAARGKLDRANAAMVAEDYAQARMLAEQAQVDAQLAVTKSRSVKAQRAAATLQEDRRVLREEIYRNTKQ